MLLSTAIFVTGEIDKSVRQATSQDTEHIWCGARHGAATDN